MSYSGEDMTASRSTITVLIPAFNEEENIRAALDALFRQTVRVQRVIVIDDCSTDRTAELCGAYSVEVVRTPQNRGSKAKALNYVLPLCDSDLIMVLDADAVMSPDYVERLLPEFGDPNVSVAAGCVLSKNTQTRAERGRSIEWLIASYFYRPIQNITNASLVIPGCATLYRLNYLCEDDGWTSNTVCEDIDYTWTTQLRGHRAVYVPRAIVWTVDPSTGSAMGRQEFRWLSSMFQSSRLHWRELWRKPLLALQVVLLLLTSLLIVPYWTVPIILVLVFHSSWLWTIAGGLALQALVVLGILSFAIVRLRLKPARVLARVPFWWFYTWTYVAWYSLRAMVTELALVPLGYSEGMTVFTKGVVRESESARV